MPQYGIMVSRDVMVEMRDGVRLATDIYRPADPDGSPAEGRFPVIIGRTSYDKSNPVLWINPVPDYFTPRGYVVLLQDLRGRGQSEGTGQYFHTANVNEGPDGYDTIEWAAAQSWSNGRTGMVGSSHGGIVQNMASLYRPPHLSALWVDVAPTNAFKWEARQGGAMGLHMYGAMYLHGYDAQEIQHDKDAVRRIEEGAENLREVIWDMPLRPGKTPIAAVPNLEEVLFHYYYDGAYNDWWGHECLDQTPYFARMADIPAVYSSGWYDPFAADASEQFVQMAKQNSSPQRLLLGPWNHMRMRGRGSTAVGDVDFGGAIQWGDRVYNQLRLRWFDRWLKDMDNGVDDDPPVRMFVMGGGDGHKTSQGPVFPRRGVAVRAGVAAGAGRAKGPVPARRRVSIRRAGGDSGDAGVSWVHDPGIAGADRFRKRDRFLRMGQGPRRPRFGLYSSQSAHAVPGLRRAAPPEGIAGRRWRASALPSPRRPGGRGGVPVGAARGRHGGDRADRRGPMGLVVGHRHRLHGAAGRRLPGERRLPRGLPPAHSRLHLAGEIQGRVRRTRS